MSGTSAQHPDYLSNNSREGVLVIYHAYSIIVIYYTQTIHIQTIICIYTCIICILHIHCVFLV